jgi:UDP-glucose 4-epimerase
VARGATVAALVRPESDLWRLADMLDSVEIIHADIANLDPARGTIIAFAPDVVIHMAWFGVSSSHWDDPRQISANVTGSLNLFEICRRAGARSWIGVGSQAEYGPPPAVLTEDVPVRPVTAYGVAKLSTGLLTQKLCDLTGMRFLWFRLLAIYGPKDDERHLIPTVIRHLLAGAEPPLTGGAQRWDYLYVEDAAEAIYRSIVTADARGIFNLGSGEAWSVRCIAECIRDMVDPTLPIGFGAVPYRADQVMSLRADISRLSAATGWEPRTGLADGLRRTLEWYRQTGLTGRKG